MRATTLTLSLFVLAAAACSGEDLQAAATTLIPIGDAAVTPGGDGVAPDEDTTPGAGADDDAMDRDTAAGQDDVTDEAETGVTSDAGPIADEDVTAPDEDVPPQAPICPVGLVGCIEGDRLVCNADGSAFEREKCDSGHCLDGACVACTADADCGDGLECQAGECFAPPLTITTAVLPTGKVGATYAATILAEGGVPPYTFSASALPGGLGFTAGGALSGVPTTAAALDWQVQVKDAAGTTDDRTLRLEIIDQNLVITTASPLKKAVEGEPYSAQLEASGGTTPYYWGLKAGALPPGLSFGAGGLIGGTPSEGGTFTFTVKALDDGDPTATAEKVFELPVGLAPLEIIGEQEVNLFVTKLITMPVIIVTAAFPVPYSQKLSAKGGKKPYTWVEEPLPGLVSGLIPGGGGLPDGLTLAADGTVSGGVTDPSQVATITIPFTQITLSGFFFQARVTDSQATPESKTALFILPTVPIGN